MSATQIERFQSLLLELGKVTGTLDNDCFARLVATLAAGDLRPGYIAMLRDKLTAALNESGAESHAAEPVKWIPVSEPPDADTTVLLFSPQASDPVWPGYLDGKRWRHVDGLIANPTHWADMPEGPQ